MTKTGKKTQRSKPRLQTGITPSVVKKAPLPKYLRADVSECSACKQDHTRVLFILREGWEKMKYPHAAKCPISAKEIILKPGQ